VPISAFASSISMLLTVRRVSSFVEKQAPRIKARTCGDVG
jgi:hypothetical protein